jgi:hypothetical protein
MMLVQFRDDLMPQPIRTDHHGFGAILLAKPRVAPYSLIDETLIVQRDDVGNS